MNPYENGQKDGIWTLEQVYQCGFSDPLVCLAHQEQVYQEEVANLPSLAAKNPAYAQRHAQYMEGLIAATRSSLQALAQQ